MSARPTVLLDSEQRIITVNLGIHGMIWDLPYNKVEAIVALTRNLVPLKYGAGVKELFQAGIKAAVRIAVSNAPEYDMDKRPISSDSGEPDYPSWVTISRCIAVMDSYTRPACSGCGSNGPNRLLPFCSDCGKPNFH